MLCLYRCPVLCPRRPTGGSALRITATTSTMSTTTATATTTTPATRMASFSAPLLSVKVNLRLYRCAEIRMGWREGEHDRHVSENKCHDEPRRTHFCMATVDGEPVVSCLLVLCAYCNHPAGVRGKERKDWFISQVTKGARVDTSAEKQSEKQRSKLL